MLAPCKHEMSVFSNPCALRHLPKDMIAPESTPFRYADNRPKMWTFIRTLFSYNIVVSRACAATHKN